MLYLDLGKGQSVVIAQHIQNACQATVSPPHTTPPEPPPTVSHSPQDNFEGHLSLFLQLQLLSLFTLSQLFRNEMAREWSETHDVIKAQAGTPLRGARKPGYWRLRGTQRRHLTHLLTSSQFIPTLGLS